MQNKIEVSQISGKLDLVPKSPELISHGEKITKIEILNPTKRRQSISIIADDIGNLYSGNSDCKVIVYYSKYGSVQKEELPDISF